MFKLWFSINVDRGTDSISGFELGDIYLSHNDIIVSSAGKSPSQSCMVFLTMVDMLNGLKNLIKNKNTKEFNLVCADSSFSILFTRKNNYEFQIAVNQKLFCTMERELLIKAIYESINNLYSKYKPKMLDDDPVIEDIEAALISFKNMVISI